MTRAGDRKKDHVHNNEGRVDHSGRGSTGDAPRNEETSRRTKRDKELPKDEGKARDGLRGGNPRGGGTRLVRPRSRSGVLKCKEPL